MTAVLMTVLYLFIAAAAIGAVFYSFRYRSKSDPVLRGLSAAKMNLHLGAALVALGVLVLTMPFSITRTIVCAVFFLLGLFNLFAGFRNYGDFARMQRRELHKKS